MSFWYWSLTSDSVLRPWLLKPFQEDKKYLVAAEKGKIPLISGTLYQPPPVTERRGVHCMTPTSNRQIGGFSVWPAPATGRRGVQCLTPTSDQPTGGRVSDPLQRPADGGYSVGPPPATGRRGVQCRTPTSDRPSSVLWWIISVFHTHLRTYIV